MKIADLFARIGIKADTQKLNDFKSQLGNVGKLLGVATITAGGLSVALQKIVKDSMDMSAAFKQFEAETGASSQALQRWQAVANETNNSANAVTSSVKALAANTEALRLGKGGNITTFQMLGIDPMQDPFKILEDLRSATANLAPAMKKNLLSQAGVSSELIQVLHLTSEQFDSMANRAFIIPPSAINSLDKARSAMQRMGNATNYIKTMIGAALAPNVEKLQKAFAEFIKQNESKIIQGAKKLTDILGKLSKAVFTVFQAIDNLIKNTVGYKTALIGLAGVFIALNSAVMLPVAGIILLFALIEDFVRYSQGKSSVIGRFFEKFPIMEEIFKKLTGPLKELFELIGAIFKGDQDGIDNILEKWGIWGDAVKALLDYMTDLKEVVKDLFKGESLVEGLAELSGLSDVLPQGGRGQQVLEKLGESEYLRMLTNPLYAGQQLGQAIENRTENTVNIEVNGSGDPEATGNAVFRVFERATDRRRAGVVE